MSARPRRRRRPATRRRVRRWVRRQDRFTRLLMAAVAALAVLVLVLIVSRPDTGHRERPAAVGPLPAPKAPPATVRRSTETRATAARVRRPVPPAEPARPPASAPAPPKMPAAPRVGAPATPGHAAAPRLAIVIDDLGQSLSHLEQIADLEIPLSIAVIPGLPATARTVREARRRGIEVLLHQPMEPHEQGGKNPGDGVLMTTMSAEAVRERLRESLAAVPDAVGVNNHMGSRFTEDAAGLGALMAELKERKLFWLDSRTTAASQGPAVARAVGVPTLERDVFLDAEVDAAFIRGQLRKLLETARQRGAAVGIGHPHAETLAVLREMRGELLDAGVILVPVSALLHPPPAPEAGTAALVSSMPSAPRGAAAGRTPAVTATP